jgi:hypothetical protein
MKIIDYRLVLAAVFLAFGGGAHASEVVSVHEMTMLQATMQQYIDKKTVDGAYLYFENENAEVRELFTVTGHPAVMRFGRHFVLCFDFVDAKGGGIEVYYFVARKNGRFVVFDESIGTPELLDALKSRHDFVSVNR